jgi:hypothetical protein
MSTNLPQSDDRKKVDADHTRAIYPHPSVLTAAEASESVDGPADCYLPDKWSWGLVRSPSFDW